jgi:tetratricopeptide (TPR) repeat protein
VRGRIVRLVPTSELSKVEESRANFRSGVALLERHQFVAADSVFSAIIRQLPAAAEAFYNRGLSRAARGARAPAIEDFEKYLELVPAAPDRATIRSTIPQLPDRVYGSSQALTSGLVVPGLGQMSTGRPVFGVGVLGGVLGAAFWGLKQESNTELQQFTDPFGNPYSQLVTTQERPNLVAGAAVAAALWIGAAVEAMFYARATRERAQEIIQPSTSGVRTTDVRSERHGWRQGLVVVPYLDGDPVRGVSAGVSLSLGRP